MSDAAKWLVLEGLLPLLGAGLLYVIWGGCRYVASSNKPTFAFEWVQALDPIGWLYGAVIISCQSGLRGLPISSAGIIPYMCFVAAAICFLLLISAMTERGAVATWRPPLTLQIGAGILVIGILYAGFRVQELVSAGVKT